eukprot:6178855-Pleurochrysis_carterae.AAC.1
MHAANGLACQLVGQEKQFRVDYATHRPDSSAARDSSSKAFVGCTGGIIAEREQTSNVCGSTHMVPPEADGQTRRRQHRACISR